jgi:hypothetical protein
MPATFITPVLGTQAIMTWAHAFSLTQISSLGVLVGPETFLQNKSTKPSKKRPKIDGTNAMSPPGRAEYFPGIQTGAVAIAGIVDANGYFDLLWSSMDVQVYCVGAFYYSKPTVASLAGVGSLGLTSPSQVGAIANPYGYQSVILLEDVSMDWETGAEGKLGMFQAQATVIGSWYKFGANFQSGSLVTAISSNG